MKAKSPRFKQKTGLQNKLAHSRYFLVQTSINFKGDKKNIVDLSLCGCGGGLDEKQILVFLTDKYKDREINKITVLSFSEFLSINDFNQWITNRVNV